MKELIKFDQVPKTTEGLRDALFDEINSLRTGNGNLQRARVLAQLAGQVIDSLRIQIQHGRLMIEGDNKHKGVHLGTAKKPTRAK